MPYRIAAPPEVELPEADEPFVLGLRARERRARFVVGASGLAVLITLLAVAGEHRARRSLHAFVAQKQVDDSARAADEAAQRAEARARDEQVVFDREVRRAALHHAAPSPDACPFTLPPAEKMVRGRDAFPLLVVGESELGDALPSQAVARVLGDLRHTEWLRARGLALEARAEAEELDRAERYAPEVVVVTTRLTKPRAISGQAYEPGAVAGRAYLYDFVSRSVICAADVSAESSHEIGYAWTIDVDAPPSRGQLARMGDAASEDMRLQLSRSVALALR